MEVLNIIARGLVIGLIIGMPMGPVGALVIQRVLINGKKVGLISGLGSTVADMVYAIIAAFGVTFISNLLTENKRIIQIAGGAVVFMIGIRIFKKKVSVNIHEEGKYSFAGTFTSTFLLSISNPTTIISSIALLAGIGVHNGADLISFLYLLLGITIGAYIWWIFLTFGVLMVRERISPDRIPGLNKFFGVMVALLGLYISLTRLLNISSKYLP